MLKFNTCVHEKHVQTSTKLQHIEHISVVVSLRYARKLSAFLFFQFCGLFTFLKFSSSLPLLFFLLFFFVFWPLSVNLHPSLWAQKNDFPQRERVQIKQVLTLFSGYLSPVFLSFSCFHYLALLFFSFSFFPFFVVFS